MDIITKVPGLQHISEDIFKLLGQNSLMNCRSTNSSWKNILDQSIFWLNKMKLDGWKALAKHLVDRQLAKNFANNLLDSKNLPLLDSWNFALSRGTTYVPSDIKPLWRALIQELEKDQQPKEFVLILIKIYNNRKRLLPLKLVDFLMQAKRYPDLVESILENENPIRKENFLIKIKKKLSKKDELMWYSTSIHLAALYGFTGVVEKLSKKYDDPMVKDADGINAIHFGAMNGHLNIVKHLMGFTNKPLDPDNRGWTPIHYAAVNGNLDTIKFLVDFTETPNAPNNHGRTPMEISKFYKNMEVQKFLENHRK